MSVQQDEYKQFVDTFPSLKFDENGNYMTRELNGIDAPELKESYSLLPNNQSFIYLCDRDSSKFYFEYDRYHMEEGHFIGKAKFNYKHYAVTKLEQKNHDLLLYSKFDKWAERYILRTFDKTGGNIDELIVNEEIREYTSASLSRFSHSLISPVSIKVFNYDDVENPSTKDKKTPLVTKVVIEDYVIDSLGRFDKVAVDSIVLSKPMRAYTKFNNEPEPDDPVYKYWTLW